MSSLFNIAAGGQAGFYDYQIENSLRFEDGSASYLNRTPASNGDRQTWTWSGWVKRGNISSVQDFFSSGIGTNPYNYFRFSFIADNSVQVIGYDNSAAYTLYLKTSQVFRDPSAWYHIVLALDTTESTSSDRAKLYVNGTQITSFITGDTSTTYPSLNASLWVNSNSYPANIGRFIIANNYFDGYLADVNFIDGQALDPTSFGEPKSGVWIPKDTSGLTFGTNGFRLEFGDSSAIGDDTSGNGNDWTATNLSAHDVVPDSPTVNYATLSSIDKHQSSTLSEGNLKVVTPTSGGGLVRSTFGVSSGKWYAEMSPTSIGGSGVNNQFMIGVVETSSSIVTSGNTGYIYLTGNSVSYFGADGTKFLGSTSSSYGATYTSSDVIGVALNLDDDEVTFYKNNVSQGTISTTLTGEYSFAYSDGSGNVTTTIIANFGQDSTFAGATTAGGNSDANGYGDFKYAVPSGFLALNSANLPEPDITPLDDDLPEDYFDTVLYTGNGSSGHVIDGIQTNPDFTWIKDRNVAKAHMLFDSLRGDGTNLYPLSSDGTGAERTDLSRLILGDGQFEIDVTESSVNANNQSYVAWNWQAGGTAVSNTDGSITSSVSANTKAGFSIVSFAVPASGTFTIGHGLNAKPAMIITKGRDSADNWVVYHKSISTDENSFLQLNTSNATGTATDIWGTAQPTSTVMGMKAGTTLLADQEAIAYCFAEVEGYSKFGNYVGGSSSTDNTFVYTGFRPAWVAVKQYNGTGGWHLFDNKRTPTNVVNKILYANVSNAEVTFTTMDFVSNGFKFRTNQADISGDGQSYIYMAFAEMPFKYANAR